MKCLREVQVQASVSAGPADGLFINCSTVQTLINYSAQKSQIYSNLVHTIMITVEIHQIHNYGIYPDKKNVAQYNNIVSTGVNSQVSIPVGLYLDTAAL